jgi:hypothetical protein
MMDFVLIQLAEVDFRSVIWYNVRPIAVKI